MATWNTMTDLANGDLVTETHMDTIRGNIEYLLTPNSHQLNTANVANLTTTSTSFVAASTTYFRTTIETHGGVCLIVAQFMAGASSNIIYVSFDLAVDGTRIGDTTYGLNHFYGFGNTTNSNIVVAGITTPSAGTHNFDLYWKVSSGTGTIGTNTAAANMFVIEL